MTWVAGSPAAIPRRPAGICNRELCQFDTPSLPPNDVRQLFKPDYIMKRRDGAPGTGVNFQDQFTMTNWPYEFDPNGRMQAPRIVRIANRQANDFKLIRELAPLVPKPRSRVVVILKK